MNTQEIESLKTQIEVLQRELDAGIANAAHEGRLDIERAITALDHGYIWVAEQKDGHWHTHAWVKQAIMMFFKVMEMQEMEVGPFVFRDKIIFISLFMPLALQDPYSLDLFLGKLNQSFLTVLLAMWHQI